MDTSQTKPQTSSLKESIAERKQKKQERKANTKKAYWVDIWKMTNQLKALLLEFTNLGIYVNNKVNELSDEEKVKAYNLLQTLVNDINTFKGIISVVEARFKSPDTKVSIDIMPTYLELWVDIDNIQSDIVTVLSPTSFALTELVDKKLAATAVALEEIKEEINE